jgi:hypothetical protein
MLINGDWSEDEFLFVPPGHTIKQSYNAGIVRAEAIDVPSL